jgi:hypothetical protein
MTGEELLAWLSERGVVLAAVGGDLHCDAPAGVLTDDIKQMLASNKAALLARLTSGATPQSLCQRRLWFLQHLNPDSAAYNERAAVRLTGPLSVAALEQALGEIAHRHEILRTFFPLSEDAEPCQVVLPFASSPIRFIDLAGLDREAASTAFQDQTVAESERPLPLEAVPPIKTILFRVDEEDHVLVILMHHIMSDGWSMGILWEEFAALYAACGAGRSHSLPELERQYADFARWQCRRAGTSETQMLSRWKEALEGAPLLLDLPFDWPRPARQSFEGGTFDFRMGASVADRVREMSRRTECSPFLCCLSAFQALVYRYTGKSDFLVGVPISGRNQSQFHDLIGYFSNTLVVRADCSGQPSFDELLMRTRRTVLDAYENQETPFERIVEGLQVARTLSHSPVFQVVFTFQREILNGRAMPGLDVRAVDLPGRSSKFDLVLSMSEDSDGLTGRFTYCSALFRAETIQAMASHFCNLLASAVSSSDTCLDEFEMLNPEERALFATPTEVPELNGCFDFS